MYTNRLYADAFTLPPLSSTFRRVGEALPANTATERSDLFLAAQAFVGGTPTAFIELAFDDVEARARRKRRLAHFSEMEAASVLEYHILDKPPPRGTGGRPVRSKEDFDNVIKSLQESGDSSEPVRIFRLRHPWSVMGGAIRAGQFVGYLQLCLEQSGS